MSDLKADLKKGFKEVRVNAAINTFDKLEYDEQLSIFGYDEKTCSICFDSLSANSTWYYGNNAHPINFGRCCDGCNGLVMGARVNQMK